ncbi:cyclophane-forming radical SAM peptide maturase AmcB [Kitasatospora misakiensis]|uniref:Cyclophane-forming radical SAM peptide maturase AmcB n=1 Tax=Kitasatospora misakiensis TaxID=67330 RepID=A0ABW0X1N8_9ACTN
MPNLATSRFDRRIARKPRTVVVQPTGYCNLACTYCYLPNKDAKTPMSVEVATAIATSIGAMDHSDGVPVAVIWHAGEPMSLGVPRFTELLAPFRELVNAGIVEHGMQTNATLVSDRWIDMILEHRIDMGISIDGPAHLNAQRVDRKGRPAFNRIVRGIERLRQREVPFDVISVITEESIDQTRDILDFFVSLGAYGIGLNIEEAEGLNQDRPQLNAERVQQFWTEVINWTREQGPNAIRVREVDRLGKYLRASHEERARRRDEYRVDPIPTVTVTGDVVLLSPELAGHKAPEYGDFVAGNVLRQDISSIIGEAQGLRYVQEFQVALDTCERTCEFYTFCLGAQAGNRFFEHGTFVSAETAYCRNTQKAPILALLDIASKERAA